MQAPDPIETVLARLMPPGLSRDSQSAIDAMLDELGGTPAAAAPAGLRASYPLKLIAGGGIAAAIGALCAWVPMMQRDAAPKSVLQPPAPTPGLVLLSETDRVESMAEVGWQEDPTGAALRTLRLNVVEQNSVKDEESGMVVEILEPRQEILLVPVRSF